MKSQWMEYNASGHGTVKRMKYLNLLMSRVDIWDVVGVQMMQRIRAKTELCDLTSYLPNPAANGMMFYNLLIT